MLLIKYIDKNRFINMHYTEIKNLSVDNLKKILDRALLKLELIANRSGVIASTDGIRLQNLAKESLEEIIQMIQENEKA